MYPILISIPHSSYKVPREVKFKIKLTKKELMSISDLYTDEIYDIKNTYKLKYEVSRQIVDPNRFLATELKDNLSLIDGIFAYLSFSGKQVYNKPLTEEEILKLLHKYYFPFHRKIDEMIKKHKIKFFIDGHSMCSVGPKIYKDCGVKRSEIIIGNRDYTTCSNYQTEFIRNYFEKCGYQVAINDPYKGKAIMKQHCYKDQVPGIQVEINRSLYHNEKTLEPYPDKIKLLNQQITDLVKLIVKEKNIFKIC